MAEPPIMTKYGTSAALEATRILRVTSVNVPKKDVDIAFHAGVLDEQVDLRYVKASPSWVCGPYAFTTTSKDPRAPAISSIGVASRSTALGSYRS